MKRSWPSLLLATALISPAVFVPAEATASGSSSSPIERISIAHDGGEADSRSWFPAVSADGRFVAFASAARNLLPEISSTFRWHVYVRDRATGVTERVSVASDGTPGNDLSNMPSISADGRYVAFSSRADNLVPGDTNGVEDVFVHDRETGTTERVSVASDGTQGDRLSERPAISAGGRFVTFQSFALNLAPGNQGTHLDVFVHDRQTRTTEQVSVASDGTLGNGGSFRPEISANGRFIAFQSIANNLAEGATNQAWDVYVRDRVDGTTERVSVATDGTEGDHLSERPAITGDGRYVAFRSHAENLVPSTFDDGTTARRNHVYVHDRQTRVTERVSVADDGSEAEGSTPAFDYSTPAISDDGRYVAFEEHGTNLGGGSDNGRPDIYVHDRRLLRTERISMGFDGQEPDRRSLGPDLVADMSAVVFESFAGNLVPDDSGAHGDVFAARRAPTVGLASGPLLDARADGRIEVSGAAAFAGAVAASVDAPSGNGGDEGHLAGVEVVARPAGEDFLVRLRLSETPPPQSPLDPRVYGFAWEHDGARWEARASARGEASDVVDWAVPDCLDPSNPPCFPLPDLPDPDGPPSRSEFALFRCQEACARVATLSGGIGTVGNEVSIRVPLEDSQLAFGDALTATEAFVGQGTVDTGALEIHDSLTPGDVALPLPEMRLAAAASGTPPDELEFDTPAELTPEGAFSGVVADPAPGEAVDVWARACLATACGTGVLRLPADVIEKIDTILELTVEGRGDNMTLKARLGELGSAEPIAGRTIDFYSDGELIGSDVTDADGVASVAVPPGHRGANRTYDAVFEGDDSYRASSDSRPGRGSAQGGDRNRPSHIGRTHRNGVTLT